jgi:heme-degrading monooxygenase HmoA
MFARMVNLIVKPGRLQDLCRAIDEVASIIVKQQSGFVDHWTMISEEEPRLVSIISLWETREDAQRYEREAFPKVREILLPIIETPPVVRTFDCISVRESAPSRKTVK